MVASFKQWYSGKFICIVLCLLEHSQMVTPFHYEAKMAVDEDKKCPVFHTTS